jgi:hypothetical protein
MVMIRVALGKTVKTIKPRWPKVETEQDNNLVRG